MVGIEMGNDIVKSFWDWIKILTKKNWNIQGEEDIVEFVIFLCEV